MQQISNIVRQLKDEQALQNREFASTTQEQIASAVDKVNHVAESTSTKQ